MKTRLSSVDYDNIYTYAKLNGWGSNVVLAETYGVSKEFISIVVSAYKRIMANEPIQNKNTLKLTKVIQSAKEYKLREYNMTYCPNITVPLVSTENNSSINNSNQFSFESLIDFIREEELAIKNLQNELSKRSLHLKAAKKFLAILNK